MDHFYTINGWIKGMNSSTLKPGRDAGMDGISGYNASNTVGHENFARDVAGYTIGYFENDYKAISNNPYEADLYGTSNLFADAQKQLFNGNISHLVTAIDGFEVQGTAYKYDQLQRLKEMRAYYGGTTLKNDNTWSLATASDDYFNSYSYDENGNILNLLRNGISTIGLNMDELTYNYSSLAGNPSNRLDFVEDDGVHNFEYAAALKSGQVSGNYTYDKIGQLTKDVKEGISEIEWFSGSKKVKKITRDDYDSPEVEFAYNPFGQRILKIVRPRTSAALQANTTWNYTFYTYDANGQVMAVYETKLNTTAKDVKIAERNIYGAGRIGVNIQEELIYSVINPLPLITDVKRRPRVQNRTAKHGRRQDTEILLRGLRFEKEQIQNKLLPLAESLSWY